MDDKQPVWLDPDQCMLILLCMMDILSGSPTTDWDDNEKTLAYTIIQEMSKTALKAIPQEKDLLN